MLRITTVPLLAVLLSAPALGNHNAADEAQLSQAPKVLVVRTSVDQNGEATDAVLFPVDTNTMIQNDQAAEVLASSLDESKAIPIVTEPATTSVNGRASNYVGWRWNYGGYYGYGYRPYYGYFGYRYGGYRYPYYYNSYYYYRYPYRYYYYYNPYYYYPWYR